MAWAPTPPPEPPTELPPLLAAALKLREENDLSHLFMPKLSPPPEPPTDEEIEEAAKLIYASMRFAHPDRSYTRDWVERGNSLMQDEARRTARTVIERWGRA
jgi:hypothetical protein